MLGHGAKFDQKMEQAIAALLSHRSVEEAARAVGISANTLLRWMKEPEFEAAWREARRTAFSQAIGRLQDFTDAAVKTVLKIMLDPNAPAGTRLRAAEVVLEQGTKASEMEDLEDRVAKLERTTGSARKSRKRSADLTWLSAMPLPGPAPTQAQIAAARPDGAETDEDAVE
jgi:transposase-like protein